MLNEEKWGKGWSNTLVADSLLHVVILSILYTVYCYYLLSNKVTAAYYNGLTNGILSQGSVQHS